MVTLAQFFRLRAAVAQRCLFQLFKGDSDRLYPLRLDPPVLVGASVTYVG